jgi:hypothetical protein
VERRGAEIRGLLKASKKFRFWVYRRYFRVETDAMTLEELLNQSPNGLPCAVLTRWLTYIQDERLSEACHNETGHCSIKTMFHHFNGRGCMAMCGDVLEPATNVSKEPEQNVRDVYIIATSDWGQAS